MKFLKHAFISITISTLIFGNSVFAADTPSTTVLPSSQEVEELTEQACIAFLKEPETGKELEEYFTTATTTQKDKVMGCAIKSGYIKFWMIPYFIKYILEWVINLSGLIAVLMILVGAYFYIWGGIQDEKTKGKTIIMYALGGLILTSVAWFLVNVILLAITG